MTKQAKKFTVDVLRPSISANNSVKFVSETYFDCR